jgi:nucleoid-associated protein YgaU
MKIFCLRLVLFFLLGTVLFSFFSQKVLAKDSYGVTLTVQATPSAVIVDNLNNIYYAGYLASGSAVQMNPRYNLDTTHEPSDTRTATIGALFLTKLNSDLTYHTSYLIESAPQIIDNPASISLAKIATDSASNVYLLGSFTGVANFDPTGGADYHSSGTNTWSFLLRMNANGTYGGTYFWQDNNIVIRDLTIDTSNNIYLLGQAANSSLGTINVNLNPLGGSDSQSLNPGDTLGFYTRLVVGTPYTYDYSRTFKNTGSQYLEADHIATTSAGNIFVYGVFAASTQMNFNMNNGGDHYKSSYNGSRDLYLNEYDASGGYVTTYLIGNSGNESAQTLGIDNNDNVYYSGGFNGTVNFNPVNPGVAPDNQVATLSDQRFLSKLNSDGSYGYTLVWNSNTLDINKIVFDQNNLMYLVGISTGGTNYDPIATSDSQLGFGGNDAFMTVINPDKTYNYTYVWGGVNDDKATDGAFDSSNDFYVTGSTQSQSVYFDPTSNTATLPPFGPPYGGEWGYVTEFSAQQVETPTPTPTPGSSDNSSNNSSGSSGGPQSFTCTNHAPAAPKIFQIWATQTTATIYFVPSADQEDSYTISYGLYSDAGMYNVTFNYSDKSGAIPYTINALTAGSPYFFKVRANNGCMSGEWSNTLSLNTAYSASGESNAYASNNATASVGGAPGVGGGSCSQYTVMPGDSLWAIAQKLLGAGGKYLQVWNANKTAFPSLNYSSIIRSGWTLSVGC